VKYPFEEAGLPRVIQPFLFQAHPAYRTQIGILSASDLGLGVLPALPPCSIEHERWRRDTVLQRIAKKLRTGATKATFSRDAIGYVAGPLPPKEYGLMDSFGTLCIDCDDPLTLFAGASRGRLPGDQHRRWALQICERLGPVTLSFWTSVQLLCFLANLRADESREALATGRLTVLPPAILPRVTHSAVGDTGKLRCLTIASGKFWHKGTAEAIVAVDRLASMGSPVSLTIVGEDMPLEWRTFVAARPYLRLTSTLARDRLDALFCEHDVLLFPSHHDTFGWVLLEAKSFGMPALATDAYNRAEIVEHGIDGLLVRDPFFNPFLPIEMVPYAAAHIFVDHGIPRVGPLLAPFVDELTECLHRLAQDSGLLAALGRGALAAVQPESKFGATTRVAALRSRLLSA
jgi:glycosyltransferase involved in cell wall biosynthesis